MRAAVYARYSSENQRPESIEDQVSACRRLADERGMEILDDHIYSDQAQSGARKDRPGLASLLASAATGQFSIVLVDDLSRLARDNYLMLSVLAELHFEGIRVLSVADGLDSDDEEATLGIQIRGIFNELQLRDLKKKTLRGQIGQKERGFFVGERTFGFRSVPVGEMRMDKKGRPRPEGYRMEIEPSEAAIVLRIFKSYADGQSLTGIVRALNQEGVPGRFKTSKGWSPATVSRILDSEKYAGRWVWNKTESRRDPRTGRRRRFEKPESEWVVREDESLQIVPDAIWQAVRARRRDMRRTWPGGKGKRGFSADQGSRQAHFPAHLLSGAMVCGTCESAIAQVSGKSGGYYGCLAAAKGACENKLLVRRKLAERVILATVRERLADPEGIRHVLRRVEDEIVKLRSDVPEAIRLKEAELGSEERRLANFLDFMGEGRGSRALGEALVETERRVEALREELDSLRRTRDKVFRVPPIEWIHERMTNVQSVLEHRTARSALLLRQLLGPIRLEPIRPDVGRPYYRAVTSIDALALIETPPEGGPAEGGSRSSRKWRRRESNPRPRSGERSVYKLSRRSNLASQRPRRRARPGSQPPACPRCGGSRPQRASPFLKPVPLPTGRGRTDSR
jgi:site-specific DNA recombinase